MLPPSTGRAASRHRSWSAGDEIASSARVRYARAARGPGDRSRLQVSPQRPPSTGAMHARQRIAYAASRPVLEGPFVVATETGALQHQRGDTGRVTTPALTSEARRRPPADIADRGGRRLLPPDRAGRAFSYHGTTLRRRYRPAGYRVPVTARALALAFTCRGWRAESCRRGRVSAPIPTASGARQLQGVVTPK